MNTELEIRAVWENINAGRFGLAETACREILRKAPGFTDAEFALGVSLFRQGNNEQALKHLEKVLAENPDNISALGLAARILLDLGQYDRAMELGRRAYEIRPDEGPMLMLHIAGRGNLGMNRPTAALAAFQRLIELDPSQPAGYLGMADAYIALGSTFDAVEALAKACDLAPNKGPLLKLAELQLKLAQPARALESAKKVLVREPGDMHANALAGQSLVDMGRLDDAESYWRRAAATAADPDWVEFKRGAGLSMMGLFEESEAHLRQAIKLNPRHSGAYKMLFANRKAKDEDQPIVLQMEVLAEDESLDEAEKAPLTFSLGKAWDDLRDPEKAFRYYDRGHEIQRGLAGEEGQFQPAKMVECFEAQKALFSGPAPQVAKTGQPEPIFVLGMMRSGTTLTEHILSAHSQVVGAGELDFWNGSERLLVDRTEPKFLSDLVEERRAAYRRLLASFGADKRVVDKFPGNLSVVGMIHHILPNAHIIHLRRNPIDVAVSLWATYSSPFSPFTATREGIVFGIRQAQIQGDYWRQTLPADRFLDVRYEDLVSDHETWVRRILDFCGLPFEEACPHASESTKKVRTPSMWQVRQPIYKSSMDRWKRYEPWLGKFRELLRSCGFPRRMTLTTSKLSQILWWVLRPEKLSFSFLKRRTVLPDSCFVPQLFRGPRGKGPRWASADHRRSGHSRHEPLGDQRRLYGVQVRLWDHL